MPITAVRILATGHSACPMGEVARFKELETAMLLGTQIVRLAPRLAKKLTHSRLQKCLSTHISRSAGLAVERLRHCKSLQAWLCMELASRRAMPAAAHSITTLGLEPS